MNWKNHFIFSVLAVCALFACTIPANSGKSSIPSLEIMHNPEKFNNQISDFTGFILVDGNIPKFYPSPDSATRQNIDDVIDLAPSDGDISKQLDNYHDVTCIVLTGKFRQYKDKFIGFGNFVSKFGVIEVSHIAECH